eukprot:scaffold250403_cov37-Prasinocladus_malaysianus.AAC.1
MLAGVEQAFADLADTLRDVELEKASSLRILPGLLATMTDVNECRDAATIAVTIHTANGHPGQQATTKRFCDLIDDRKQHLSVVMLVDPNCAAGIDFFNKKLCQNDRKCQLTWECEATPCTTNNKIAVNVMTFNVEAIIAAPHI